MKTLLGISTLNRDTAPNVFNPIASLFDKIFVVVQGECGEWHIDGHVYNKLDCVIQAPGLVASRNRIFQYAIDNGYDYVVQSDDDLAIKPTAATKVLELIDSLEYLGSVTAVLDTEWGLGGKNIKSSNGEWVLKRFPNAFWAAKVSVIRDEIGLPTFLFEHAGDKIVGAQMWAVGRPCIYANSTREYTIVHKHPVSSPKRMGGLPPEERNAENKDLVDYLNLHFVPETIKAAKLRKTGGDIYSVANWSGMTARVTARWGGLGYSDSKGRKM